jgi:hypothetical protein
MQKGRAGAQPWTAIDILAWQTENCHMKTKKTIAGIPARIFAELQQAADDAAKGNRNRKKAMKACAEMDRIREEIRKEHGILHIGVPAIRELRDA